MGVDASSHPDIQEIESHVRHADTDFTWACDGIGDLDDLERFRATMLIDSNRFHANAL